MDLTKIETIIYKHNGERGRLIPILQDAQVAYGYLPKQVLERIAAQLTISPSVVEGVVSFYAQFRESPIGKNMVKVCHGTACHIGGAEKLSEALYQELGVDEGDTTEDGKFTVERVACLGCCSLAPCVMINEKTHGRLTSPKIKKIIKQY
jgi:NADH-quinone oxidoreductase subunit E